MEFIFFLFRSHKKRRAPPPPLTLIKPIREEKPAASETPTSKAETPKEESDTHIGEAETHTRKTETPTRGAETPTREADTLPSYESIIVLEESSPTSTTTTAVEYTVRSGTNQLDYTAYTETVYAEDNNRGDKTTSGSLDPASPLHHTSQINTANNESLDQGRVGEVDTGSGPNLTLVHDEDQINVQSIENDALEYREHKTKKKDKDKDQDVSKHKKKKKHKSKERNEEKVETEETRMNIEEIPNFRMIRAADVQQVGSAGTKAEFVERTEDQEPEELVDDYNMFDMDFVPTKDEVSVTEGKSNERKHKKKKKKERENDRKEEKGVTSEEGVSNSGWKPISKETFTDHDTETKPSETKETMKNDSMESDDMYPGSHEPSVGSPRPGELRTYTVEDKSIYLSDGLSDQELPEPLDGPNPVREEITRVPARKTGKEREEEVRQRISRDMRARANRRSSQGGDLLAAQLQTETIRSGW